MALEDQENLMNSLYGKIQKINEAKKEGNKIDQENQRVQESISSAFSQIKEDTLNIRKFAKSINDLYNYQGNIFSQLVQRGKNRVSTAIEYQQNQKDINEELKRTKKEEENLINLIQEANENQDDYHASIYEQLKAENDQRKKSLEYDRLINAAVVDSIGGFLKLPKIIGTIVTSFRPFFTMVKNLKPILTGILAPLKFIYNLIESFTKKLGEAYDKFLEIQNVTGDIQADIGLTNNQFNKLRENAANLGDEALRFGLGVKEALQFTQQLSEQTGKNQLLLGEQVSVLSKITQSSGLASDQAAELYGNIQLLGGGLEKTENLFDQTVESATKLGLNVTQVLQKTSDLIQETSGLRFENGIQGISSLVQKAQSLRVEIDNLSQLADDFMRPEKAIEQAANLRVLGGAFADMADPMQLMYQAQNAPDKLAEGFLDASKNLAVYNEELGRFEIPTKQRMRMQQVAEATAMDFKQLKNAALEGAENMKLMNQVAPEAKKVFDEKQLEGIANMAKIGENGVGYIEMMQGEDLKVSLDNLNKLSEQQLKGLAERTQSEREIAMTRQNLTEQFGNIYDRFILSLTPLFNSLDGLVKDSGLMASLREGIDELQNFIDSSVMPLFKSVGPVYQAFKYVGTKFKMAIDTFTEAFNPNEGNAFKQLKTSLYTLLKDVATVIGEHIFKGVYNGFKAAFNDKKGGFLKGFMGDEAPNNSGTNQNSTQSVTVQPKMNDFIYDSQNSRVMPFSKDDLLIGGSSIGQEGTKDINLNINGQLDIKGENGNVQLGNNELRNIVSKEVVKQIADEMDNMKSSGGIKKSNPTPPIA